MTQAEALEILKTGVNVFLTGEPGSGKTFAVNAYVAYLRGRGIAPAITASTGIAATHVGGYTIHSWSGIGVKRDVSDYDIELLMSREKTARRIIEAKVLIIDEISMLDAATLGSVDRVLRILRRKPLSEEEPFGGLQVVLVGDFFQLPPVSKNERAAFAFSSLSWKAANPVVCYLAEQHRQDDAELLELLSSMRCGALAPRHRERLRRRVGVAPERIVATRLYTHNAGVDRINAEEIEKLEGESRAFTMRTQGARSLVASLVAGCLSPEELVLKEGASVMFTRNNFEAGYVNGTQGTVESFGEDGTPLVRTRDGRLLAAEPAEWALQDGNKVLAKLTQVPLRLAWAITVHKSQGMSLDAAIIDLGEAFEYGQGYVAVSRVRTLGGLYLERMNERALMLHPAIVEKDREFRKRSDMARERFAALPQEQKAKMQADFLRAIGAKEPEQREPQTAKRPAPAGAGRFAKLREKFPNAGRPWSAADDEFLKEMFARGVPQKEIAKHFGRKPSAIHARLGHLGLVEDHWARGKKLKSA